MKKISLIILALITIVSCTKEHSKDFLTFQGTLENNTDSILTISGQGFNKTIKINADGSFKDTMKVTKTDIYPMQTNTGKRGFIHLANGYNLTLTGDSDDFLNSFKYTGEGSEGNNFGVAQVLFSRENGNPMEYFALEKDAFDAKIASIKEGMENLYSKYKNADTSLVNKVKGQNQQMFDFLEKGYEKQHPIAKQRAEVMAKVAKGKPSPKFVNYENYKGGTTSLDDLKGKFVYIDLWATWCGPCIREIPALQKLEAEYHNKNVAFVSISSDSDRRNQGSWEKANTKWKNFVAKKELTGIQLWAGKDISFMRDYQVNSIPRFILIDPQGNIVDNNAPRPSDPKLKKLFTELGV